MRGKLSINPERRGIRVLITNFEGKSKEEIIAYAQKVLDRNAYPQYRVGGGVPGSGVHLMGRDDTVMVAEAWVP